TLFYEGKVFSGRVSATNRDDYLTQAPGTEAGFNLDGYHGMTGTTVIDASIRYTISDQLELSLEGINLTNEASDEWVYSPATGRLPLQYTETGRQFLLGVRYKF
ncbi:TonB-dependent receptor, partial [Leclercia adecarboxylata]